VQGGESIDVGGVDVGALVEQLDDLVLVAGKAGGEEDTAGAELDPAAVLVPGGGGGAVCVRLLPALQLLGALHHRRVVACVQRGHLGRSFLARRTICSFR